MAALEQTCARPPTPQVTRCTYVLEVLQSGLESIVAAAITAGAHDADVAAYALAAEEASSAGFLALANTLEAISTKEIADKERDEKCAVNADKHKKQTTEHERK